MCPKWLRKWIKPIRWWNAGWGGRRFNKANKVYLYKIVEVNGKQLWTYTSKPKTKGACMYGLRIAEADGRIVRNIET